MKLTCCLTTVMVAAVALSCGIPSFAGTQSGLFEIEVGHLWMNVGGYNEHIGDTVEQSVEFLDPPSLTDDRFRRPIFLSGRSSNKLQPEIRFVRAGWGVGARGWAFSSADGASGQVASPATGSTFSSITNTVDLWSETLPPVINELETSNFSPVDFRGSGSLRTYTVDVFALRRIGESGVHLLAGAKIGALDTVQSKGSSERAFIFDFFSPGIHFNNFIDLGSQADSSFRSAGPMAGVELNTDWRRLTIALAVSQAILIGDSEANGLFTDVDEITSTSDPEGPFIECTLALAPQGCTRIESNISFSTSKRRVVPASEVELSLRVRMTENISVGGNAFASIWANAPVAPSFFITHAGVGPGLNWQVEQRTLVFTGVGASVLFSR